MRLAAAALVRIASAAGDLDDLLLLWRHKSSRSTRPEKRDLVPGEGLEPSHLRVLSATSLPIGPAGHCGQPRYRTEQALLARQHCTPVRRPWSRRSDSNRLPPLYKSGAQPAVLRRRGWERRIRTFHELLQRQPCCRVTSAPIGAAGYKPRRPSTAGECGPRRGHQIAPQPQARLGGVRSPLR